MTKTINPDVAAFKDDFFKGIVFQGVRIRKKCIIYRSGRNPATAFLLWCRD